MAIHPYMRAGYLGLAWGGLLGAIGFLIGYFGNEWLAANPGSAAFLNGIFITGPASLALGIVFGVVCGLQRTTMKHILFAGTVLTLAVITASLALVAPEYSPHAKLIRASAVGFTPIESLVTSRTQHWAAESDRVSREHLVELRSGWRETVPQMVARRPGCAVVLKQDREAWIEQRAWRNGRVEKRLASWRSDRRSETVFFDGNDCQAIMSTLTSTQLFCVCFERSDGFPPAGLPEYLGLWVGHPVPKTASSTSQLIAWALATCPDA